MRVSEEPSWKDVKARSFPMLDRDLEADVAVIGGGVAGVACAYFLAKAGVKTVLLESETIGAGITSYTTAFLTEVIDTDLSELVKLFGAKKARLAWQAGQKAINAIEQTAKKERISCDFKRCPLIYYANSPENFEDLEKEHHTAKEIRLETGLSRQPAPGFRNAGYLAVPQQAKFHPLRFLYDLARAAEHHGALLFQHAKVADIKEGEPMAIKVGARTVRAKDVIVATYAPMDSKWETFLKKGMYMSYVFEARLPKGAIPEGIYQDTANPYHYFRIDPQDKHDRMIIGGEDHRKELKMDPEKNYRTLEEYLQTILAGTPYTITRRWSSKILEPTDGLALIGRTKPHEFVATAFSGNGMTYSFIAGILLTDLVLGKKNPWEELYDPKRIPNPYQFWKKGWDYVGELFGGAVKNAKE